jgi:hypothetical protein
VSKNDYVFTPIIFTVKQNAANLNALNTAKCSLITSPCPEFVQPVRGLSRNQHKYRGNHATYKAISSSRLVKNSEEIRRSKAFAAMK